MKIPLIDLKAQYQTLQSEIDGALREVVESTAFVLSPKVAEFEEAIAGYLGLDHVVGVASGTDALILALEAHGIGAGDEVICPTYTFFATAEAVIRVGAKPVFVDIEPAYFSLDVSQVADRVGERTRAIIPVHLYGHPADMTALTEIAAANELLLIEDSAQALGAEWCGSKTATIGDTGCLSFFPSKNLGAYGDAGMLVTHDAEIAERVRKLRTHGWVRKYLPEILGHNSRLDALQAAVLLVKLPHLERWNERRRELARMYAERLADLDVVAPTAHEDATHAYHMYVIRVSDRDRVSESLREGGIASAVYYPVPLHLTEPCRFLGYREGEFPHAEKASGETLALPFFPEMTESQLDEVVSALRRAVAR